MSQNPVAILESVAAELEVLRTQDRSIAGLVELHGALFLYALDGDASLIPNLGLPIGSRRLLETRISLAARRLAGRSANQKSAEEAMAFAAQRIEELIYLIDPELGILAA